LIAIFYPLASLQVGFFDHHALSPPSLRAVYFIAAISPPRHCERLEKPRGNPCSTMCGGLKNGSPRFARDDAVGVFLMAALSLHRHCERLEKLRGNPCSTMCDYLKMDRHASLAMTRRGIFLMTQWVVVCA